MRIFKKIIVKILSAALAVIAGIGWILGLAGKILGAVLQGIGRVLFGIALPVYGLILSVKRILLKFYAPLEQRTRLLHLFTRRYFFHFTFIGIALMVVTTNLNAYEVKRDELTYSNVFTGLAQGDEYGDIEEVRPPETPQVKRYFSGAALDPGLALNPNAGEAELTPGTITGGNALVKPIRLPSGESLASVTGAPRTEIVTYTVQEGDTISGVAVRFGVSVNTILWENNLTAYSIIRPGQTLTILPTSGVRHQVAKNDTLGKIASKYSVTTEAIINANKLASADDLQIGEKLIIPNGAKPRPVPTYALRRPASTSTQVVTAGQMAWPATCQRITQYYGWRHTGLDVACASGTNIYAAESGRVIKAQGGWNGGYGIMIVVQHENGSQTLYGHLSKLYVQVGDEVTKGQTIAGMGSTGRSTGPHVHFEVRVGGFRKNPLSYLR